MRLAGALLIGAALGVGAWWWSTREERERERIEHERQAAAEAEAARPVLYRWRDAQGHLQVTAAPPKGRRYERVDLEPRDGIEVRGDRGADLPGSQ
jgi:hypothetical protein